MVSISKVKVKIDNVINQYGNDITIRSPGVESFDEWGQPQINNQVDVQTVGVTDAYNKFIAQIVSKAKLAEGSVILLLKGDEVITKKHTIILDSIEYNIESIEDLKVSNVIVAYNVQLNSK